MLVRKFGLTAACASVVLSPLCSHAGPRATRQSCWAEATLESLCYTTSNDLSAFFFWCCTCVRALGVTAVAVCRCVDYDYALMCLYPELCAFTGWLEAACGVVGHSNLVLRTGWAGILCLGQHVTAGPSWDRQNPCRQNLL